MKFLAITGYAILSATALLPMRSWALEHRSPVNRDSVSIPLPSSLVNVQLTPAALEKILKLHGLSVDAHSTILLHEEDGFVDLSCFDCVVSVLHQTNFRESPVNDKGF